MKISADFELFFCLQVYGKVIKSAIRGKLSPHDMTEKQTSDIVTGALNHTSTNSVEFIHNRDKQCIERTYCNQRTHSSDIRVSCIGLKLTLQVNKSMSLWRACPFKKYYVS